MSEKTPEAEQDLAISVDKINIKHILDMFSMFLRYIASGFVGLIVYTFLFWDDLKDLESSLFSENTWLWLVLAASLGLITYTIHKAHLDVHLHAHHLYILLTKKKLSVTKSFENYLLKGYRCFDPDGKLSYEKLIESPMNIRFSCKSQSFLRCISSDKKIERLGHQLSERYAFLAFTYCAFYQSAIVLLYFLAVKLGVESGMSDIELLKSIMTAIIIVFVFWCAYNFDRKICKREIWIISEFGQDYPRK